MRGIKEASGDLRQILEILRHRPADFAVLSGDDSLAFSVVMAGGDGLISVTSNEAPGPMTQLVHLARQGDLADARACRYRLLPLMDANFLESNPSPVKAGLAAWARSSTCCGCPSCPRVRRRATRSGPLSWLQGPMSAESIAALRAELARFDGPVSPDEEPAARVAFMALKAELNAGEVRAAERGPDGDWRANAWVKAGILLGFRLGRIQPAASGTPFPFYDKDTFPLRRFTLDDGVRIVPGGSAIRDGCYVAPGVVCMPPMYVNVGAYVGEGTIRLACTGRIVRADRPPGAPLRGAQIGGVLEPAGALPVIIEDEVLVGGNCGVYEGTVVRERAVLAPGTLLTGGTLVFDLVHDRVYRREGERPLEIPASAVVAPVSGQCDRGPDRLRALADAPVIGKSGTTGRTLRRGSRICSGSSSSPSSERSMPSHTHYLWFETRRRQEILDITDEVQAQVKLSGVREGLVLVSAMHISASVFVNDHESGLWHDILRWLEGTVAPWDPLRYRHNETGEDNAAAHLWSLTVGHEVTVPITAGTLDLGPWQRVFYGEWDGQRRKRVIIKVLGEA